MVRHRTAQGNRWCLASSVCTHLHCLALPAMAALQPLPTPQTVPLPTRNG